MNTNYIIYAHISPSGKYYIGQTKVGVDQRWEGIKDCCTCRQKTAYGYKWKYKDE